MNHLLRPKVKHFRVSLYEDGKPVSISSYDSYRQSQLMQAIESLCETSNHNYVWFESEIVEHRRLFGKPEPPTLFISCYTQNKRNPVVKDSMNIPPRYRNKLLGKSFILPLRWSKTIEVRFHLPH